MCGGHSDDVVITSFPLGDGDFDDAGRRCREIDDSFGLCWCWEPASDDLDHEDSG